ncbi:MAG: SseB family protein, partial [Microbacterium sp.]|nr:SseB family protein [Microbacterium sp.]
ADDDTDMIVIDPGSATEFVLRRPAVWAIGQDVAWEPSFLSPEVFTALQASVAAELAIIDLAVAPGDPGARLRGPELVVQLRLIDGLDREELDAVLQRLARRWAADDRIAVLVDSLSVKLRR